MKFEREHKTEQIGASYDTDYKVITRCTPDCPACAQKELVKWQDYMNVLLHNPHEAEKDCLACKLLKHFELGGE